MSLNADLREFIELLNSRGVEYVIVGAHSLAFHGRPRYTGDLDLLVRPSRENAAKLVSLLRDFGFEKGDFAEADFTVPEQMIQLGVARQTGLIYLPAFRECSSTTRSAQKYPLKWKVTDICSQQGIVDSK